MPRALALLLIPLFAGCGQLEVELETQPEASARVAVAGESLNAGPATDEPKPGHFGGDFTLTNSEPLQTLLDDAAPYIGKDVRVVGEITEVSQAKGFWMVVRASGGESIRITMKDDAFAVDKDLAGKTAHVQGVVVEGADGKTMAIELAASAVQIDPGSVLPIPKSAN